MAWFNEWHALEARIAGPVACAVGISRKFATIAGAWSTLSQLRVTGYEIRQRRTERVLDDDQSLARALLRGSVK